MPRVLAAVLVPLLAALAVGGLGAWSQRGALADLALSDTDDAMRLVQVQDLVDGQAWSDLTQDRMDPPDGVPMHWSRHVDALIIPFHWVFGADTGPRVAAVAVPTLLLVGVLAVLLFGYRRLGAGSDAVLLTLAGIISIGVATQYAVGRLDHHGLQILLTLGAAVALLVGRHGVAGVLLGSGLGVGLEVLPAVAGALVALSIGWVIDPDRFTPALRWFLPSLVVAAGANTLLFAGDGRLWSTLCDVFSLPLAVGLSLGAAALVVGERVAPSSARARLAAVVGAGLVTILGVMAVRPACAAGPFVDIPDDLVERWLSNVSEATSLVGLFGSRPGLASAMVIVAVVGWVLLAVALREDWRAWIGVVGLVAGVTAVFVVQVRGFPALSVLLLPGLVVLVRWVRSREWPGGQVGTGVVLIASLVVATGSLPVIALGALDRSTSVAGGPEACSGASDLASLGTADPTLVLAPLDVGPAILLHTDHAILGAPYHRNVDGIRSTYDLFAVDDAAALEDAGVGIVALCDELGSNRAYAAEGGLMDRLLDDDVPAYLRELEADGPWRVYRFVG